MKNSESWKGGGINMLVLVKAYGFEGDDRIYDRIRSALCQLDPERYPREKMGVVVDLQAKCYGIPNCTKKHLLEVYYVCPAALKKDLMEVLEPLGYDIMLIAF